MNPKHQGVSLAVPTFNRPKYVQEAIAQVIDDVRVTEIVLSDDHSEFTNHNELLLQFGGHRKVRIFRNPKNMDCYANKLLAVERATKEWVILLDDDNIIGTNYLDTIWDQAWKPKRLYCPDFAQPHFDYRQFSGKTVNKATIRGLMEQRHFPTLLNTANYFFRREDYLAAWDGSVNPHTADSMYMAYRWLLADGEMYVVPGLNYFHRVHEGSHYKNNVHKTGNFAAEVETKLKQL